MTSHKASPSLEIASIFFGTFIGLFFFTTTKVARQSWRMIRRTRTLANWYLIIIWVETVVNMIFALTTYLFIRGTIKPSLGYYIGAVSLWMLETQLLIQIIANRVGLILVDRRKTRLLKWCLFFAIALVNISVYCIWIPAQLGVNQTYVHLNHIWERVEKSIFLCVDLGLNLYFLYLVRSHLISQGLTRYWRLFNFNACIVVLSVTMDLLLLGLLSLPNPFDYVQFAPIAYTIKLNIELTMAILISKIVRGAYRIDNQGSSTDAAADNTHLRTTNHGTVVKQQPPEYYPGRDLESLHTCAGNAYGSPSLTDQETYEGEGIVKTVTMFVTEDDEVDRGRE